MDKTYADTVRLLLAVAPDVFANDIFAMKGGTAINLFVRDMPRLSVDIDVVYLPWQTPRDEALQAINQELAAIATRVAPLGVQTRLVRAKDLGDTKLIVENDASQVKIEVNVVFRGSVLPVERRPLSAKTSDLFGVEFELPVLAPDELYASKLVAALDRQHPRDLFDVWQLYESGDISDGMVECFVIYLAGHNRPPHEVLFGNDKDIAGEYERAFVGMAEVDCPLDTLLDARAQLRRELQQRLTKAHIEAASASTAPIASAAMDTGVAALLDLLGDAAPPTAPEIPSSPVAEPEPAPSTVPPPQMSLAPSQDRAEPSGAHFMAWLRQSIQTRKLIINDAKALVHTVAGTTYLVSPGVFQRYAQEYLQVAALAKQEKLEGWQWVQKRFEKLGQHRKQPSGLNIWTCEVTGPRKSRRLHGYLLVSPDTLFQETPPDNPYLRLLNEAAKREDSALGGKDDDQA